MKQSKKLLSLLLVFVMLFSMAPDYVSKATSAITVTLRVEQDQKTLVPPTQLTLTSDDIKSYGALNFPTDKLAPCHVLAKYFITKKGATEETLANYIGFSGWLTGISVDGKINTDFGSASSDSSNKNAYWMFAINDSAPVDSSTGYGHTVDSYSVQNKDEITFYGVWSGDYTNKISPYYTTFSKKSYEITEKQNLDVTLLGFDIFNDYGIKANRAMKDAHILIYDSNGKIINTNDIVTKEDGTATISFEKAGSYSISAYRKTADGVNYDISRPYASVLVKKSATKPTLSKVKNLKATVKNKSSKAKQISLSWKKVKNATKYYVYASNKRNKGFKKICTVKKAKATLTKKKGTFFFKVCGYSKKATPRKGALSAPIKVKVK